MPVYRTASYIKDHTGTHWSEPVMIEADDARAACRSHPSFKGAPGSITARLGAWDIQAHYQPDAHHGLSGIEAVDSRLSKEDVARIDGMKLREDNRRKTVLGIIAANAST